MPPPRLPPQNAESKYIISDKAVRNFSSLHGFFWAALAGMITDFILDWPVAANVSIMMSVVISVG